MKAKTNKRMKPAAKTGKKAKPAPVSVTFRGRFRADLTPKAISPAPTAKPAKSRLIRSNENQNKPRLWAPTGMSEMEQDGSGVGGFARPRKIVHKASDRLWYAIAIAYGHKDDKVRKQLVKLRKGCKDIGKVLSPKVEVQELKLLGKCICPREVPPPEENLPPPETPRGLKCRVRTPYPRRIGECNCPKVPTIVKRKKFPGYLVIQANLTDTVRSTILTCKGVEMILMNKDNIVAVETEEAAELLLERKEQTTKKEKEEAPTATYKPGDQVKVIGDSKAPWFGQQGKVVSCEVPPNMTALVEFPLLGRPIQVAFDARTLNLVKEDK